MSGLFRGCTVRPYGRQYIELLKELADPAQVMGKIHQTDVGNAYTSQIPPAPDKELRQIEDKLVSVVADSISIWSP